MSAAQLDIGHWGMFAGPEGKQLVILDGGPCGPVSARKLLREAPRRLLLDEERVPSVISGARADGSEIVGLGDQQLRVETRKIVSPWSKTTVGVFAGVFPVDTELPEPPLVGSWEWVVMIDGGRIADRRTYWAPELYRLYEVEDAAAQKSEGSWAVDVWGGELVAESDQLRFFSSLRDGYWDNWSGVRCATFDAITGYGAKERSRKHLRLVAQRGAMSSETRLVFQGFSYRVPELFSDRALSEEYPTDDALSGFMSLVTEPMAIIDPFSLEVLMGTKAWRHEVLGHVRGLREFFGAEEAVRVRDFLIKAVDKGSKPSTARFTVGDGAAARDYTAVVAGMERGPGRDALAIVRLNG